jgi:hypothetical protein
MKQVYRSQLTDNTSTALDEPGIVRWDNGKAYRYVLAEDANILIGDVVEYADSTGYEVTKDRASGSSLGRIVAGVAVGGITDGQYGWIQVNGANDYCRTDNSVAEGDPLVPHATTDGVADVAESGSEATNTEAQVFGYALTTDTTTTITNCKVMIRCL